MKIRIASLEETQMFGKQIGSLCQPGDVIGLGGDLGAGKTTLAQAIARGAGVADNEYVTSPTFAIMHEYIGRFPIYHMDFYRLGSSDDVCELGLDEYFESDGLSLIEWFERAENVIPASRLTIHLSIVDDSSRKAVLASNLHEWQERLKLLDLQFPA